MKTSYIYKYKIWVCLLFYFLINSVSAQNPLNLSGSNNPPYYLNCQEENIDQAQINILPVISNAGGGVWNFPTNIIPHTIQNKYHFSIEKNIETIASYQSEASTLNPFPEAESIDIPIDKNLPVGTLSGSPSVSSSGSANYGFSIYAPPGTNGMLPQIDITYNSSSGNGILGRGWNLNGISTITRIPKTIFHNGKVEGVLLDATDILALDGNRLIASPSNGANTYRPEREDFTLITSVNNDAYFTVETQDGTKMYYGDIQKSTSVIILKDANQTDKTLTWYLTKVEDKYGNYITYSYGNDLGEVTLREIAYTGNDAGGIAPFNFIRFYYDIRKDQSDFFIAGNQLKNKRILREIEVFCEGNSMKKYKFNYVFNSQSYLREVTEYGINNTRLNSTYFKYGAGSNGIIESIREDITPINAPQNDNIYSEGPMHLKSALIGDFNGDGKSDQLAIDLPANSIHWKLYLNNNEIFKEAIASDPTYLNENTITNFAPYIPSTYFDDDTTNVSNGAVIHKTNSPLNYAQVLDMNGDGLDDLILVNGMPLNHPYENELIVFYSNGNGFKAGLPLFIPKIHAFLIGDVNGDGLPNGFEYWEIPSSPTYLYCRLFSFDDPTIHSIKTLTQHHTLDNSTEFSYRNFKFVDFDGDGKQELYAERAGIGNCFIKFDIINNTFETTEIFITNYSLFSKLNQIGTISELSRDAAFGDFNGDGILDYFTQRVINSHLTACIEYGTGIGFMEHVLPSSFLSMYGSNATVLVFDQNEDGNDDLVRITETANTYNFSVFYSGIEPEVQLGTIQRIYLNNPLSVLGSIGNLFEQYDLSSRQNADFDGDGHIDIFFPQKGFLPSTQYYIKCSVVHFNKGTSKGLLKEITNGYRNKTEITYNTLSNGGINLYTKGSGAIYPIKEIQTPLFVVSKMESPDGIGGKKYTSYKYVGLKSHLEGLGSLSFDKMSTYNSSSRTLQELTHNTPDASTFFERTLQFSKTFLIQNQGNLTQLSERTFITEFESIQGGSRHFRKLTQETLIDNLTGATNITTNVYNNGTGMLIEKHTNVNSGLLITDEIYTPYTTTMGSWLPNKIQSITITTKRDQELDYTRTNNYVYDAQGSLTQTTSDPGTNNAVVTNYTYDGFTGVLLSTQTLATGLPTKNSSFSYDIPYYRFPITSTNTLNQITEIKFDPRWGKPIWQKSTEGLISEIYYDGFGTAIKSISPDKTLTIVNTSWVSLNEIGTLHPFNVATKALFSIKTQSTGSPSNTVYFDSFSRKIFSTGEGFGRTIYNACAYNSMGSLCDATSSYDDDMLENVALNKIIYTHTSFDEFNRISETSSTDGSSAPLLVQVINTYPGTGMAKTTVIEADGKTSSKTIDASGLLVESEDDAGTKLNYTYFSSGQLKNTSLSGMGVVKSMEYLWGRLTKVEDKNSGVSTTIYNAYGLPESITDANLRTTLMTYDVADRIKTKTCLEGTYIYDYVLSGYGLNLTERVIAPNGNKIEYKYDRLNRPIQTKETINTQEYITELTYNNANRLEKYTYPGGFTVEYVYDSKGFNTEIKRADNDAPIWRIGEISAAGQFTKYTLGNNAQSENTFTNFGFPLESKTPTIQDLSYNFDVTSGNMMQRKDVIRNLIEDFTYDNLNRLTSIKLNNVLTGSINYLANGNIESKSELGLYSYGTKPNAVNSIEDPNNLINQAIQNITYTSFNKVDHIDEANYKLDLSYGAFDERKKSILTDVTSNSIICERLYLDGFEKTIQGNATYEITYINAPTGLAAMFVKQNDASAGTMNYIYTDNLGSINTVVDDAGYKQEQSFDAWGNRRNPANWTKDNIPALPSWLYRGYTGHEHLKEFALINMNGRMYDPVIARFLSPDKLLQDPTNTQNYNGYSYVMNNPLKYNDPSGWAYRGYQFYSLRQGFNLETPSNGGEAWDPNGSMGYLVDGVACTKFEYLEAERAGGIVHPKGVSSFFKVTKADGTVVNTADAGEAASLFNEGNNEHKVIFENGRFNYYDVVHDTPPNLPDNNLTASIDGGGLASVDPQDGGTKCENAPGCEWDSWGEGSKPYLGNGIGNTNFIGPGSDINPYNQKDKNGMILQPVDAIDRAAQAHDYAYWKADADGITGAFINRALLGADASLIAAAASIMTGYNAKSIDEVTGTQISTRTYNLAKFVYYSFTILYWNKMAH